MSDDYREQSLENWQRVAAGWERRNEDMWRSTEAVSRNLVERLAPQPGDTVLELAAGVGRTGLLAAELIGPNGRLVSSDFSRAMLDAARRLGESLGLRNIDYRVIDAEQIDLPDDSVDGVLCRWGFMLFGDPARALAETRRVLRSGGRLSFSVWASAEANPWAAVIGRVLVSRGVAPPPDPDAPGMFALASDERIDERVRGAGFTSIDVQDVPVTFAYDSFQAFWDVSMELSASLSGAMDALPEDEQAEVRAAIEREAASYRDNGAYALPGLARNVLAA